MYIHTQKVSNITPITAWLELCKNKDAALIDVRDFEEHLNYGIAKLDSIGKSIIKIPIANINDFSAQLIKTIQKHLHIFFICKSGIRSKYAASIAKDLGYKVALNIEGGMENRYLQNETIIGWKKFNLPWK